MQFAGTQYPGGQAGGEGRNPWEGYAPGRATTPAQSSYQYSGKPQQKAPKEYRYYRPKDSHNRLGERLDTFKWDNEELVPVVKNFMVSHPAVEARTEGDCLDIRLREGIDARRVGADAGKEDDEIPKPVISLEETPFPDWAAVVLRDKGWTEPTPIQSQGWPVSLTGHDMIGIASTGSGKTMAYVLPMLIHVVAQPELRPGEGPVGLVLLPCRELCDQVKNEIQCFAQHTDLTCETVFGGAESAAAQGQKFLERVDIVVATPGRLIELCEQRQTNLKRVTSVVLDEADQMLDRKFKEQVGHVMSQVRPDRQVSLFSATWSDEIEHFAMSVLAEKKEFRGSGLIPGIIQVIVGGTQLSACKDIDQQFWCPGRFDNRHEKLPQWDKSKTKLGAFIHAMQMIAPKLQEEGLKALVFVNKSETVQEVVQQLKLHDIPCEGFFAGSTEERQRKLDQFRDRDSEVSVLICTQVLGRGLDFHDVKFVVNYDMPERMPDYVHRIGRTGRAGVQGFALTLLDELDLRFARDIVRCLNATNHFVPNWLQHEGERPKYWRRKYNQWLEADGAAENPTGLWRGRGRDKRSEFLGQLKGTGLSRGMFAMTAATPLTVPSA